MKKFMTLIIILGLVLTSCDMPLSGRIDEHEIDTFENTKTSTLEVLYLSDLEGDYEETENITLDDGEYSAEIVFIGENLKNFKIMKISFTDYEEEIGAIFEEKIVYSRGIRDNVPLIVEVDFPGDLPSLGVSYINTRGEIVKYAVNISGKDGSISLVER